jgi:hypothetical protein
MDIIGPPFTGITAIACITGIIATIGTGSRLELRNLTTGG